MNIVLLPGSESSLKLRASTRRIGLCWEATRAPRWTRIPQAWAAQAARAGLLRDRQQSEKSQGFGDGVPESFPDQTKTRTRGKSALAFSANRRFTLNQYKRAKNERYTTNPQGGGGIGLLLTWLFDYASGKMHQEVVLEVPQCEECHQRGRDLRVSYR